MRHVLLAAAVLGGFAVILFLLTIVPVYLERWARRGDGVLSDAEMFLIAGYILALIGPPLIYELRRPAGKP